MRWLGLAMQVLVRVAEWGQWFAVIFLAVYFALMAAFYKQGQILMDRLP